MPRQPITTQSAQTIPAAPREAATRQPSLAEILCVAGVMLGGAGFSFRESWVAADAVVVAGIVLLAIAGILRSRRGQRGHGVILRNGQRRMATEGRLERLKDAEWEMADRNLHYRALLDAQQDFVVQRAADGHVVFANAKFCRAFDLRAEDIVGTMFHPPVISSEPSKSAAGQRRRIVQKLRTIEGERWISWDQHEFGSADGELQVQSVGRDITTERTVEQELKAARNDAEAASRAKSRFLASMSHEIRTPMNGILGMLTLLGESELTGEQRVCTDAATRSAMSLLKLIDGILDFSKIEAGKLELMLAPFSIRECAADAMRVLAADAAAKALQFTADVAADVPDIVVGDELRVRQILLNLLSNAVKFTDSGEVRLAIRHWENSEVNGARIALEIEVSDTGSGVSSDMMRRLFEEFEQDEALAARGRGGTGLGLAITRRLVRVMGGDVSADATANGGARFIARVLFDRADALGAGIMTDASAPRVLHAEKAGGSRAAYQGKFRVLVAEDNAINALLSQKVVQMCGGEAVVVADGDAAVAAVASSLEGRSAAFDLILMDVRMPGTDGLAAARAIKALFGEHPDLAERHPPVIALTANAFAEDRELCRAAGMDDYLAKPFDVRHLKQMLHRWLSKRSDDAPGRLLPDRR